ncbi:MAG: IS607 family element RNA-guided endonuclease TnpB [Bifidobacteriaceae bacterium]|nr:IS607 family element RNA-guided endonuclease TnpB [Bifidobacteriaceae bacterium]
MLEAVVVALDPSPAQERALWSHAGAARFAYNAALAHVRERLERHERPVWSFYALRKWWNQAKDTLAVNRETGGTWWRQNSKEAYNAGLESLADGLRNWSDSRKGRRKGRRVGFPRFKSKDGSVPRFAYTTGSYGLIDGDPNALRLPRIGRVHCMEGVAKRVGGARVVRMTVSRRGGRWQASLTVERPDPAEPPVPPHGGRVGVDLGLKTLATLSDGTVIGNPRPLRRSMRRLRHAQRALSRKRKGSNRRRRARERVARLHARVAHQRRDFIGKATTMLARTYTDISIEDLNVQGMESNHCLAQAVADAGFYEFRRQLEYKAARSGAGIHVVDRWYPSSKTCSRCGTVKAKLSLACRTYRCERCGLEIDRDLNAAINIMVAGSAPETLNARGEATGRDAGRDNPTHAAHAPVKREPSRGASHVRLGAGLGDETMQATN